MSTERHVMTVRGVEVNVVRKAIKNLHLGVYPPTGRVRVAAPLAISDDAVRLAVVAKLGWIKRQRAGFEAQPRESKRELVSGESHYVFGRRYRLRVMESAGRGSVALRNRKWLELRVRPESDARTRELVLREWYRGQLRTRVPALLAKWEAAIGVRARKWGIKRMKTKWGACSVRTKRIWLNLELAKKPLHCLEYVIVHELTHLLERHHNERFIALMDSYQPRWRAYRQELNSAPLPHHAWR